MNPADHLKACHCCGLVHRLPAVPAGHVARCTRCGAPVWRPRSLEHANSWAAAAAWAALLLYPLGISLPVIRVQEFGHLSESSVFGGVISLLGKGDYLVGGIVLVCSLVVPVLKLAGLIAITSGRNLLSRRHRAGTYRMIDLIGRWGMVDVLLVALLVSFLKIRDLVEMHPGPGVFAFTLCVLLSLVASACYDSHALWEREP